MNKRGQIGLDVIEGRTKGSETIHEKGRERDRGRRDREGRGRGGNFVYKGISLRGGIGSGSMSVNVEKGGARR
jgi:hypothetical protein